MAKGKIYLWGWLISCLAEMNPLWLTLQASQTCCYCALR